MNEKGIATGFNTEETMYDGIDTAEFGVVGMEADDISNTDVMYYLEEMIQSGLADEIEENVYYDIKLTKKCKKSELKWVKDRMVEMYGETF